MKMWAGRFSKDENEAVNDFNSSIKFDFRMFRQDIQGSLAHAQMLAASGVITREDGEKIAEGLTELLIGIENGEIEIDTKAEDIHMFIEEKLTEKIGGAGKRLHTARSRNDQVALDIRLWLRDEIADISSLIKTLALTLCDLAEPNAGAVMPGYTHLQRAQPITFGHHLMAYAYMFLRDIDRLADTLRRMNKNPLGSGALAGTTYQIDRGLTTRLLGFDGAVQNSLDGVSDRDFCMEFLSSLSILMVHLSRFSEEIILWCSWEFKFIELDDAYATGSSIMPQKKNPDVAELVRGKSGRVFGSLMSLLTVMKGLPLAYNKDIQEDKEAVFDAVDTVKLCLKTFTPMLKTMRVLPENMRQAAAKGFINATDCADYLVKKGMAFRDAYKITGELVAVCLKRAKTLETLELNEYRNKSTLFAQDIYDAISLESCLAERKSYGGPCRDSVLVQIKEVREVLKHD